MEIVSSEIGMAAHFQKQMSKSHVQTQRYKDKEKCRNGKSNIKNRNTHKRSENRRTVQHLVALKPTDEGEKNAPKTAIFSENHEDPCGTKPSLTCVIRAHMLGQKIPVEPT